MTLADAAQSLDDLANDRPPSSKRVLLGLNSLDTILLRPRRPSGAARRVCRLGPLRGNRRDVSHLANARARYAQLAAAVRAIADE